MRLCIKEKIYEILKTLSNNGMTVFLATYIAHVNRFPRVLYLDKNIIAEGLSTEGFKDEYENLCMFSDKIQKPIDTFTFPIKQDLYLISIIFVTI